MNGDYSWFKKHRTNADGCQVSYYDEGLVYDIISNNRYNQDPVKYNCDICHCIDAMNGSYIAYVEEDTFLENPQKYIDNAFDKSENDGNGYILTPTR